MIYRKHQETDLTSLHKAGIPRTLLLLSIVLAASCRPGGQGTTAGEVLPLDRTAWLGSAEGWGLLGLPRDGGALTYRRLDGGANEPASAELDISFGQNGPIFASGDVRLVDGSGQVLSEPLTRAALCRCGASGNKPFCDNSHFESGFEG